MSTPVMLAPATVTAPRRIAAERHAHGSTAILANGGRHGTAPQRNPLPQDVLTIVKTTNGQAVRTAPGPYITVGAQVHWRYTVTNNGNERLSSIAVADHDHTGAEVFSIVIDTLDPGASVVLGAWGRATPGQYRNMATAAAVNPAGGQPLTAAAESWYFGVPG